MNGIASYSSASWQRLPANTSAKARRFISKASCVPVNGLTTPEWRNTPPRLLSA
nr:MAG TPA: hypothetical protein [Caudoviricetes sp.]